LQLAPDGGPEPVVRAREAVRVLVDQAPGDQAALADARARLTEAEATDRQQLAQAMREGRDPISDTSAVEKAGAAVSVCERTVQARAVAVQDAQAELRDEIEATRSEWAKSAQQAAERARARAAKALNQLEQTFGELRQAQAAADWLAPGRGFDNAWPFSTGGLGDGPRSAAFHMANEQAPAIRLLLGWLQEACAGGLTTREPAAVGE
jgi:hypothetical protein